MPARTEIGWADYSSNPLKARANGKQGWSCAMVSAECARCYAATLNNRFGTQLPFNAKGVKESEHYLDEKELRHILTFRPKGPFKNGRTRPIVFPFDMTDVFGDWVKFEMIDKFFAAFALRPDVDFMVLTKRPERMARYFRERSWGDVISNLRAIHGSLRVNETGGVVGKFVSAYACDDYWAGTRPGNSGVYFGELSRTGPVPAKMPQAWPLPNVWLGVSVGVKSSLHRIDTLREIPAALRFVSFEPLLEDLGEVNLEGIGLGITGGESGPKSREHDVQWSWSIGYQLQAANLCWFHKQHGSNVVASNDGVADWFDQCPHLEQLPTERVQGAMGRVVGFKDKSGSNPSEWGEGWLQQMPEVKHG